MSGTCSVHRRKELVARCSGRTGHDGNRHRAPREGGGPREGKKLVIVESPTKMKSIQGYLGDGYEVLSSVGHIRDLADKKDIPAELKKTSVGKYSIDVENGFDPLYVESDRGKKTVAELKRALKGADELLLATDEDREGEAIAWHLLEALKPKVPVKRMVFHEITKDAIRAAVDNTRELDLALVDAQETRRILDRLYGWDVSPSLRKVGQGTSAGRVQSAATRLVVDRERERMAFVSAEYWDVEALARPAPTRSPPASPASTARHSPAAPTSTTRQLKKAVVVLDESQARELAAASRRSARHRHRVEAKPGTRSP
jgi:DNA topoisomerase-1